MKRILIFAGIVLGTVAYFTALVFAPPWLLGCILVAIFLTGAWKMSGYLAR